MRQVQRFAPSTELEALRGLLSGYAEGDRTFDILLVKSLQTLRQLALPELGQCLARRTAPRKLRMLILDLVARFEWCDWDHRLMPMLQKEEDIALFEAGCARLGGLCTTRAIERLRHLQELRRDPQRQEILERELAPAALDTEVLLGLLLAGSASPEQARMAARGLAAQAGSELLGGLLAAWRSEDKLARHLGLRVLAFLPDPSAGDLVLSLFREALDRVAAYRELEKLTEALKTLPRSALGETFQAKLKASLAARDPELAALVDAPDGDALQEVIRGPLETFLAEGLQLARENRTATLQRHIADVEAALPRSLSALREDLDPLGDVVGARISSGELALEDGLPLLEEAFLAKAGGDGILVDYLRLVPGEDKPRLFALLSDPDVSRRRRIVEVLGAREDDKMVPFFLQAMQDVAPEVARLAVRQFGKLPSGMPVMMDFFRSGKPEKIRQALHFFTENRTPEAAKPLLGFIASPDQPDDLVVDAVRALGSIKDPNTVNGLLAQLHSGKPLAFQQAAVEALTQFATPAASLGLLKKAEGLTLPEVLTMALQGALAAFKGFDAPFPQEQVKELEKLVGRCCDQREGGGQWLAAANLVQDLYVFDSTVYERLQEQFASFVEEGGGRPGRDLEANEKLTDLVKKFGRRGESLAGIKERENVIQAQLDAFPPSGARQLDAILKLEATLAEPDLILGVTFGHTLSEFLRVQLEAPHQDWHEVEHLAIAAGHSGQTALADPLRQHYQLSTSVGIRSAMRQALLRLGLSEQEIERRPPIRRILVLEPNAFFRKRITATLEAPDRTVATAADRGEAEGILAAGAVDLLISEHKDPEGVLIPWISRGWEARRFRYVLLSTADHDLGAITEQPWIIGRLYKPYPMEELLKVVEG